MNSPEVANIIKKGGIGILPTDTLYGVVGSAFSKKAVTRLYKIKSRSHSKPLIILIPKFSWLKKFGVNDDGVADSVLKAEQSYKGSISIIVPCSLSKFEYLHRGTKSLAFRVPKKKALRTLLEKTGPLVAPSANPQGMKPASTILEAKKYFGEHVDFYISGGKKVGKPSRVISLLTGKPVIVRK
ncbi:MAG: threonylcarbamoyl-AMP synthase [Candidatus Pacebacteria bacterium]|nr:threonylcarbamoyl-AMP synthase [Candidatus Paceibacterota bacterium]